MTQIWNHQHFLCVKVISSTKEQVLTSNIAAASLCHCCNHPKISMYCNVRLAYNWPHTLMTKNIFGFLHQWILVWMMERLQVIITFPKNVKHDPSFILTSCIHHPKQNCQHLLWCKHTSFLIMQIHNSILHSELWSCWWFISLCVLQFSHNCFISSSISIISPTTMQLFPNSARVSLSCATLIITLIMTFLVTMTKEVERTSLLLPLKAIDKIFRTNHLLLHYLTYNVPPTIQNIESLQEKNILIHGQQKKLKWKVSSTGSLSMRFILLSILMPSNFFHVLSLMIWFSKGQWEHHMEI